MGKIDDTRFTPRKFTYLTDLEKEKIMKDMYPDCKIIETDYGHIYVVNGNKE